jgi:hypothetical protein
LKNARLRPWTTKTGAKRLKSRLSKTLNMILLIQRARRMKSRQPRTKLERLLKSWALRYSVITQRALKNGFNNSCLF